MAAQLMRRVLVDHARARLAEKRDGGRLVVPLEAAADVATPSPLTDVLGIATKSIKSLGVAGLAPTWSPVDDRIAYATSTGEVRIVNADGSEVRNLAPGTGYVDCVDWSPDGKYLIAVKNNRRLAVIDVATGDEMPIFISAIEQSFMSPAWKR